MPGSHSFVPRLDPIGPSRRLDPNAPLTAAWLGGRPVILARPDPSIRRPGVPADLTVPITVSRLRRAIDIERGRATGPYEPSLIDDWPLSHVPIGSVDEQTRTGLIIFGMLFGAVLVGKALLERR